MSTAQPERIGAQVREVRQDLHMSIEEAAAALGLPADRYTQLENDQIALTALDLVNLVLLRAKVQAAKQLLSQ